MPHHTNAPDEQPVGPRVSAPGERAVGVGNNDGTIISGDVTTNVVRRGVSIGWLILLFALLLLIAGTYPAWKSLFVASSGSGNRVVQPDLLRTPRMGIEAWQNNSRAQMSSAKEANGDRVVDVTLKREPFTLRFPHITGDQGLKINASVDASHFTLEDGNKPMGPPFCNGCSYAANDYFDGKLVLGRGANYFRGTRVTEHSKEQDEIYVSGVFSDSDNKDSSLQEVPDELFLTCWIDRNGDGTYQLGEFEFMRLTFVK
ncbi:hypothetical protein [Streptomyces sp. NPDC001415]